MLRKGGERRGEGAVDRLVVNLRVQVAEELLSSRSFLNVCEDVSQGTTNNPGLIFITGLDSDRH